MSARLDDSDIPSQLQGWEVPPHVEPLLDYTGRKESGNRYDVLNGGGTFDPNGPHPLNKGEVGPNGQSSAAGRFQFIRGTWDNIAGAGTPMTEENQRRAAFKNAFLGYKQRTGRDLVSDMAEKGLTPEIAAVQDATWAGKPVGRGDTLAQYGGSAESVRGGTGGGGYNRLEESNMPWQQQATKTGLLGMLGVNTTENERLALMKAGFRTMQTPGVLGKAIGAGGEAYVDTLMELNKQQRELATAQSEAKLREAQGKKQLADAASVDRKVVPGGFLQFGTTDTGQPTVSLNPLPKTGEGTTVIGGKSGTQSGSDASTKLTGNITNPAQGLTPGTPEYMLKMKDFNQDLGPLSGNPNQAQNNDKESILQQAASKYTLDKSLWNAEENKKKYYSELGQAENGANAAKAAATTTAEMANALVNQGDKALEPGAAAAFRYKIADYMRTIADGAGVDTSKFGIDYDKLNNAVTANQVLTKFADQVARSLNPGNPAAVTLQNTAKALPNIELNRETSNLLFAQTVVNNGMMKDRYNSALRYGDLTNQMGADAFNVFSKANPGSHYAHDVKIIADLMDPRKTPTQVVNGKQQNPITMYMNGYWSREKFDDWMLKNVGSPNFSRYFD